MGLAESIHALNLRRYARVTNDASPPSSAGMHPTQPPARILRINQL